jgi:hypothetical protein
MLILFIILALIVFAITIYVGIAVPFDSENYKKCKYCKKSIKIESARCRYCKKLLTLESLRDNENGKAERQSSIRS